MWVSTLCTVDNSIALTFHSISISFYRMVRPSFMRSMERLKWNDLNKIDTSRSYFGLEMVPNRSLP